MISHLPPTGKPPFLSEKGAHKPANLSDDGTQPTIVVACQNKRHLVRKMLSASMVGVEKAKRPLIPEFRAVAADWMG